jgi:hypothetical protein
MDCPWRRLSGGDRGDTVMFYDHDDSADADFATVVSMWGIWRCGIYERRRLVSDED